MLQRIYTASGLLDLCRHKLARFLCLRKFQHIRQDICQRFYGTIQIAGCKCETVRIDIVRIRSPCLSLEDRNINAHDVLLSHFKIDFLLRCHKCCIQCRLVHSGLGYDKVLICREDSGFYFLAKCHVLLDQIQELTHQLISFVLKELMAPSGCDELPLGLRQFHTGRSDLFRCH